MGMGKALARSSIGLAVACAAVGPVSPPAVVGAQAARPVLSLRAPSTVVQLQRFEGWVSLDLGIATVAGDEPFEIHVTRPSYSDPIVATWQRGAGPVTLTGLDLDDFTGFPDFFGVVLRRSDGTVALETRLPFCPNSSGSTRLRPDAPARSPYPRWSGCPWNPFTLGSVWGIQAGWGVGTDEFSGPSMQLDEGRYTATVWIRRPYRRLFGLSWGDVHKVVRLRVTDAECDEFCGPLEEAGGPPPSFRPAATAPTGVAAIPPGTPLPDLRSLPAFAISVERRSTGREFLTFGANVWNAGPSPLVVDGFRRRGGT